jgi:hypothetical protein
MIARLLGNRLKHIRSNVSYLVTWNVKEFTVEYSTGYKIGINNTRATPGK